MAHPHGTAIWYELQTPDPDAATRFYDAVAGWTIGPRPAGEMDYRMIAAEGGDIGGVTSLNASIPGAATRPGWLMYLGVDDVDAAVAAIVAAGGSVAMGPLDLPGTGRFAKVADPQGAPFYVMRGESAEAESEAFSPTRLGRCSWNELSTTDPAAGITFYTSLFGWRETGTMPMGEMGDYHFLSLGDAALGAAMGSRPGGVPPGWTFYFRVADIDAAARAIVDGGGTVHHGPVAVPGGDRIVLASDPHGVLVGFVGA